MRLTETQISVIWPGLNHIVCACLTREVAGQALTSYPFEIQPLPPGFDSGTFRPSMMDRIKRLWTKLRPKAKTNRGGRIQMDAFELRAAILSARNSLKIQRVKAHDSRTLDARTKRQIGIDIQAICKLEEMTQRVIRSMERYTKKANRRFLAQASQKEFKALSMEWQSHLRWIRFHLTYFKPFRALGPSHKNMQRKTIDQLVKMARQAITDQGFEPPDLGEIRRVIRLFVRYSRRGRLSPKHHQYMLRNSKSSSARSELFQFLKPRLELGDDMKKRGGKASRIAHQETTSKPDIKALIKAMEKNWERWTAKERTEHLSVLVSKDCTIRGLAADLGKSESALRCYLKPSTPRVKNVAPSNGVLAQKPPAPKTVPNNNREKESDNLANKSVSESQVNELAQVILDFIERELGLPGSPLVPSHIRTVLIDTRMRLGNRVSRRPKPVTLSTGVGTLELFRLTKPAETPDINPISYRGEWLATILVSKTPNPMLWEKAQSKAKLLIAEQAEATIQSRNAVSVGPESSLPSMAEEKEELKPYMRRLKAWAQLMDQ